MGAPAVPQLLVVVQAPLPKPAHNMRYLPSDPSPISSVLMIFYLQILKGRFEERSPTPKAMHCLRNGLLMRGAHNERIPAV